MVVFVCVAASHPYYKLAGASDFDRFPQSARLLRGSSIRLNSTAGYVSMPSRFSKCSKYGTGLASSF